jgi:hypothetical protein
VDWLAKPKILEKHAASTFRAEVMSSDSDYIDGRRGSLKEGANQDGVK